MLKNILDLVEKLKSDFPELNRNAIAHNYNIRLEEINLPESINGLFFQKNGLSLIALNLNQSEQLKNETFFHEFYHYKFSSGSSFAYSRFNSSDLIISREEKLANLFVALLLIKFIDEYDSVSYIAEKNNVSEELALIRLEFEVQNHLSTISTLTEETE